MEKTKPTVVVRWDPMPDDEGKENSIEETQQELPRRKWNWRVHGEWILMLALLKILISRKV
jgi:hypothetical protein